MTLNAITIRRIETLADEAARAGNTEQVGLCHRALDGDEDAQNECFRVLDGAGSHVSIMRHFNPTHLGPDGELYRKSPDGWVSEFVWHHGGRPITYAEVERWEWQMTELSAEAKRFSSNKR